ncbi:MAG: helix-turn-helix domain-containing protein [Chloroflexota bacterium]
MPKIYTLQQKRHALYLIEQLGSVAAASKELGIPQRTLRDWRSQMELNYQFARRDPATSYQGHPDTINIHEVRDRLLQQIDRLTNNMTDDPRKAYFAALAIDRHLEQVRHINDILGTQLYNIHSTEDLDDDETAAGNEK